MNGDIKIRTLLGKFVSPINARNWWVPALFECYTRNMLPNVIDIILPPPNIQYNYNCFVYAVGKQFDPFYIGNTGKEFSNTIGDRIDFMIDNSNILKKSPDKNNIVIYRSDDGCISHVGRLISSSLVISKWSWGPLVKHRLWDVPDHYGNKIEFYTLTSKAIKFILSPKIKNWCK